MAKIQNITVTLVLMVNLQKLVVSNMDQTSVGVRVQNIAIYNIDKEGTHFTMNNFLVTVYTYFLFFLG